MTPTASEVFRDGSPARRAHRRHLAIALACCNVMFGVFAASVTGASVATAAPTYRLAAQDKLSIYVEEWPMLTGEFTVGSNGSLSLPIIGEVAVADRDIAQATKAISDTLRARLKTEKLPQITVAIVSYRPFYILGDVAKPGEYAFRPGASVLTALGIAGGMYRPSEALGWTTMRDGLQYAGDLREANEKRLLMLVREARAKAEAEGADDVTFPAEIYSSEKAKERAEKERHLFKVRLEALKKKLEIEARQKTLLEQEIEQLNAQMEIENRQLKLVKNELTGMRALIDKGLAPAPRLLPLERTYAQIQRELRELATQIIRAKQLITKADGLIAAAWTERQSVAITELQTLRSSIAELLQRSKTLAALSNGLAPFMQAGEGDPDAQAVIRYSIVRAENGVEREIPAHETTKLQPGDIIKVQTQRTNRPAMKPAVSPTAAALPKHSNAQTARE